MSDYGKMSLAFAKERFPAMSGLAREFSGGTGYTYKAGILESFKEQNTSLSVLLY